MKNYYIEITLSSIPNNKSKKVSPSFWEFHLSSKLQELPPVSKYVVPVRLIAHAHPSPEIHILHETQPPIYTRGHNR
jgi:hypothetical protein